MFAIKKLFFSALLKLSKLALKSTNTLIDSVYVEQGGKKVPVKEAFGNGLARMVTGVFLGGA